MDNFVDLFEWPNANDGDLSVWKDWDEYSKSDDYHIEIEGNLAYDNLHDGISYYEDMCKALKEYLDKNSITPNELKENTIYRSRDVEVINDKENNCVWIHTSEPAYHFHCLYDTYFWLSDVVKQLKTINIK
jgi:hypothetical protein